MPIAAKKARVVGMLWADPPQSFFIPGKHRRPRIRLGCSAAVQRRQNGVLHHCPSLVLAVCGGGPVVGGRRLTGADELIRWFGRWFSRLAFNPPRLPAVVVSPPR